MENNKGFFTQELDKTEDNPAGLFFIQLLFEQECEFPPQEKMKEILEKHLGKIDNMKFNSGLISFAPQDYCIEYEDKKIPPLLQAVRSKFPENIEIDDLTRSQMWDCPEHDEIIGKCRFHIMAFDMLSSMMNENYKERADMLMNYTDALVEMFPECTAVFFKSSGKLISREKYINAGVPENYRFIFHAVNIRFFNIQGTKDMMVDTLGMSILSLPDLQYHFHGLDPNDVVNHALNVLIYIYEKNCPIKNGHSIDGFKKTLISGKYEQWKCQFENSLIQPIREVIDINTGKYASGERR